MSNPLFTRIDIIEKRIMKTIEQELEELDKHESKVYEIMIAEVIKRARFVLQNNRGVNEFIMAMGMMSITRNRKSHLRDFSEEFEFAKLKGGKELFDFLYTHSERFKLTGDPMRFTATSEITTDW